MAMRLRERRVCPALTAAGIFAVWALWSYVPAFGTASAAEAPQSKPIPDLVKAVSGAVVTITTKDTRGNDLSQGSGFLTTDGLVVTNEHVIGGMASGIAVFEDGAEVALTNVVYADADHDVALLETDAKDKDHPALLLAAEDPAVGSEVVVIGTPKGLGHSVSVGIVSAMREDKTRGVLLQFTASVSPGSSGGPILDRNGDVVGIVRGTVRGGQSLNLGTGKRHLSHALELVERKLTTPKSPKEYLCLNTVWHVQRVLPTSRPAEKDIPRVVRTLQDALAERPYLTPVRIELAELEAGQAVIAAFMATVKTKQKTRAPQETIERLREQVRLIEYWSDYLHSSDRVQLSEMLCSLAGSARTEMFACPEEGLSAATLAVKLDPNRGANYRALYHAQKDMGQLDVALATLKEGLRRDPNSASVHFAFAARFMETGDAENYRVHYEKLRSLKAQREMDLLDRLEKSRRQPR